MAPLREGVRLASPSAAGGAAKSNSPSSGKGGNRKRRHVLTEEHFEPINTWWEKPLASKDGTHWRSLEHQGILFHPSYVPHGIPMVYDGKEVPLPPAPEEIANFWCAAQTSDYPDKPQFVANFWTAFLGAFPPSHEFVKDVLPAPSGDGKRRRASDGSPIPVFEKADFSRIREHIEAQREQEKERRKSLTKDEREDERIKRLAVEGPYMYALHDGIREKVASYKAEVPGLFRGRGEHPRMGRLKRRIFPNDVVLNLGEDAPVPRLPARLRGHSWQDVWHDPTVTWLAFYHDTVNKQFKYVFLGASSAVKGMKDYMKYELARKLKDQVGPIRQDYKAKMRAVEMQDRQLGTATYLIDALALRVGNEKDRDSEADTVGCCSLRVEHVTAWDDEKRLITLDFLGKDSIRYLNTVTLDTLAYHNFKSFCTKKKPEDTIFDRISTGSLNRYLRDMMPGLSAKVFRTYNASITLQAELAKIDDRDCAVDKDNLEDCKRFYENANRQVAILCNHQRSVPKQHNASMQKLQKALLWLQEDIAELEAFLHHLKIKSKREFKFTDYSERGPDDPLRQPVVRPSIKEDQAVRKLKQLSDRKINLELKIRVKDENKAVANATSRQHYMDPRITVTFCKKLDLPIEKFFNQTLMKKFPWAMYAKSDFVW